MEILLAIKRVVDPTVSLIPDLETGIIPFERLPQIMNPLDEVALEAALRLKEKGIAKTVRVVSIDTIKVVEVLRKALALGADQAVHVLLESPEKIINAQLIAEALKRVVLKFPCDLILMGKQAIDDDNAQIGPMLAALLAWPQLTAVSELSCTTAHCTAVCEESLGQSEYEISLPAVITVDLPLNVPRYASLPNILKAKTKPIEILKLEALLAEEPVFALPNSTCQIEKIEPVVSTRQTKFLSDVEALAELLKVK